MSVRRLFPFLVVALSSASAQTLQRGNPSVSRALKVLDSLIAVPAPQLPPTQLKVWNQQTSWFQSIKQTMQQQVRMKTKPDSTWIKLQQQYERESQQFQMLSNILKARHEAAMNAIRNIRG